MRTIDDLELSGKRVLVRVDFNVPMVDGRVRDNSRIVRAVPTIRDLQARGATVVLLAHFGRPKGAVVAELSLAPIVAALSEALAGEKVYFSPQITGAPAAAVIEQAQKDGVGVVLLENLRFHSGEEANDPAFARELAALGECYVNDAFSVAHRAHASTEALARLCPAAAGRLMQEELIHLEQALGQPRRPVAALVGGAKVSTKLDLLENLVTRVDVLIIGGGMANTFLNAQGLAVGRSLCEESLADTTRAILARAEESGCELLLPSDVVVAPRLAAGVATATLGVEAVPDDHMILDAGSQAVAAITARLSSCQTLVWNGPLGCFETPPFDTATTAVARFAARRTAEGSLLTVAGGGDTVSALAHAGVSGDFSYVSTAGGAFLEWMEGKTLPGVQALLSSTQS